MLSVSNLSSLQTSNFHKFNAFQMHQKRLILDLPPKIKKMRKIPKKNCPINTRKYKKAQETNNFVRLQPLLNQKPNLPALLTKIKPDKTAGILHEEATFANNKARSPGPLISIKKKGEPKLFQFQLIESENRQSKRASSIDEEDFDGRKIKKLGRLKIAGANRQAIELIPIRLSFPLAEQSGDESVRK